MHLTTIQERIIDYLEIFKTIFKSRSSGLWRHVVL